MKRLNLLIVVGLLMGGAVGSFGAEDEVVFSGPQVGEGVGGLSIQLAYGDDAGVVFDPVAGAEGGPLVLLFLHQPNRPSGNFTRAVLNYCEMFEEAGLNSALIYLVDDRVEGLSQLQRGASWFGVGVPAGVSLDGAEGPGAYGLNRNVTITVLVVNKNKVVANFALVQPSLSEVGEVVRPVTKLIDGAFVPSAAQVDYLYGSTHLNSTNFLKSGQAARDWGLRALTMDLIEAKDGEAIEGVAKAINVYIGENGVLQRELGLSARMLLRKKNPNVLHKKVLQRWIKAYGDLSKTEAGK